MTKDEHKTKSQLIAELRELRNRIAAQESAANDEIPDPRQVDTELKESHLRYKIFAEKASVGIWHANPDGGLMGYVGRAPHVGRE